MLSLSALLAPLTNSEDERAPAWSPDGTQIAYMYRNQTTSMFDICMMDADGAGQMKLTTNSVFDGTPTWSPDGEKIVFGSGPTPQSQLWLMNVDDGADKTQLVIPPVLPDTSPGANWVPSWGQLWVGDGGPQ